MARGWGGGDPVPAVGRSYAQGHAWPCGAVRRVAEFLTIVMGVQPFSDRCLLSSKTNIHLSLMKYQATARAY